MLEVESGIHFRRDGVRYADTAALRIVSDTGAAVASLDLPDYLGWLDGLIWHTRRSHASKIAREIRTHRADALIYSGHATKHLSTLWNEAHRDAPKLRLYAHRTRSRIFTRGISRGARTRTMVLSPQIPVAALGTAARVVANRFRSI